MTLLMEKDILSEDEAKFYMAQCVPSSLIVYNLTQDIGSGVSS